MEGLSEVTGHVDDTALYWPFVAASRRRDAQSPVGAARHWRPASEPPTVISSSCANLRARDRHGLLVGGTRLDPLQIGNDVGIRCQVVVEEVPHRREGER